jgi:hypothetical protein
MRQPTAAHEHEHECEALARDAASDDLGQRRLPVNDELGTIGE